LLKKNIARRSITSAILIGLFALLSSISSAQTSDNTRLLRYPDIHGDQIAFTYAGDLWLVARSGGQARRLTAHPGTESFAKFSPDGKWIAFTGDYDGNTDVFVIPAEGGEPRRLTYHPAPDEVLGWTPDGKKILFRSARTSFSGRFEKLFLVSINGGMAEELPLPAGGLSSFSPDGSKIAYNRVSTEFRTWKRYRGGWQQFVSIYDLKNNTYDEVPHAEAADTFPMWSGDAIYFDSDRDGVMNIYRYDLKNKQIRELTHYKEYDVKWPSLSSGANPTIVYEYGGYLYVLDLKTEKSSLAPITVESDLTLTRPTYIRAERYINSFGLSPSGARALFGARGEIFTVPAKKGDVRNLTNTSGVRELWPAWSPDGKWIAYFSDETGEYELYIRPQDGSGEAKRITHDGAAYRFDPKWSPDSKKILFGEKTLKLFYSDINGGKPVLVDQSKVNRISDYEWAPDSKWIAYAKPGENGFPQIYLYSVDKKEPVALGDGTTPDYSPTFDPSGKYLFFLSDRNFTVPSFSNFELSFNYNNTTGIYAVTLAADTPSPFAPESDEEKGAAAKPGADGAKSGGDPAAKGPDQPAADGQKPDAAKDQAKTPPKKEEVKPIKVDLANINRRIVSVPAPIGSYAGLKTGKDRIFYIQVLPPQPPPAEPNTPQPPPRILHSYDLTKREDTVLLAGINDYDTNLAGDKIIYRAGPVFGIIDARPGQKIGDGRIDLGGLEMKVDPRAEWKQIFNEAWRLERDFYYDPTMRGLDWVAIKKRYEQELPYVAHRSDLNYIIGEMIAELSTSHAYVSGGDAPDVRPIGVGLLGVDFEIRDGYYTFKKIYVGDNSAADTRSPLTEPGVIVKEGDYLLAVNGRALRASDDPFSAFENTVGKQVVLKVNDKPTETGARSVTVRPIGNDRGLRYLDWFEGNRRKVAEATGGRCGYMYVPDTAIGGINSFAKSFYAQTDKDCLIVDERWNSGGFIPEFFVERLNRQLLSYYAPREGIDFKTPGAAIYGPKVMLINEFSGSGGDAFPYYFRRLKIGPLVGKRTWGGLVGISGGLPMIDNGSVTAPTFAIWTAENGKSEWVVENKGVAPDYDVDSRPDLIVAGHDPQLEKAIELIKEELRKNPPQHPQRPAYGPKK
jgi:tricorn protease